MLGTNCDFSDVGHWNARCRRHRRPGRGAKLGKGAALRRAYPPEKAKGGSLGIHGAGVAGLSSRVGAGSSAQLPVGMNARQWSVNGSSWRLGSGGIGAKRIGPGSTPRIRELDLFIHHNRGIGTARFLPCF